MRDDDGTALLLTLGYALLAIALILVCADATSLYLARKRVDSVADAASLAGAYGFTIEVVDGRPRARLEDDAVWEQAAEVVSVYDGMQLVDAGTPEGTSSRVTVRTTWRAPVFSLFVPDGVRIESTATSRTAIE